MAFKLTNDSSLINFLLTDILLTHLHYTIAFSINFALLAIAVTYFVFLRNLMFLCSISNHRFNHSFYCYMCSSGKSWNAPLSSFPHLCDLHTLQGRVSGYVCLSLDLHMIFSSPSRNVTFYLSLILNFSLTMLELGSPLAFSTRCHVKKITQKKCFI